MTALRATLSLLLWAPAVLVGPSPADAQVAGAATSLTVQTVPVLEGVRLLVGGRTFKTDALGRARVVGPAPRLADRLRIPDTEIAPGVRARFNRRKEGRYLFDLIYRVRMSFGDPAGRPVEWRRVASVTVKGSHGARDTVMPGRAQWLQGARVVPTRQGFRRKEVSWVVEKAIVDGSNVVNRNQQSFVPAKTRNVRVALLLYAAHFTARDALLGFPLGSHLRIEYPNGRVERHAIGDDAELTLPSLPRGQYKVSVEGPGIMLERPVALSREQTVELEVLSYLDLGLALGVLAAVALGLVVVGRPHLVRLPRGLSGGSPSAAFSRGRPLDQGSEPPRWRDSAKAGAVTAVVFGALVMLLFGRDAPVAAGLAVFMFLLYLPLSYGTETALHRSRSRAADGSAKRSRRGRREDRLRKARTRRGS